ncbi:MAG: deoxycytidylate deaminase [Candidatus Nealsonbacteria bacterium]
MVKSLNTKNILIIGEFPVIHKGYIDFFNKILKEFKAHFYLGFLDNKTIKQMTKLEPDIRKIPGKEAKKIINAYLPIKKFVSLNKDNFIELIKNKSFQKIIILKGEKSEDFAKHYLIDNKYKKHIKYYDIRLKWHDDKVVNFKRSSSKVSKAELIKYKKFIKQAFDQAQNSKCWWRQVGAVLVKKNSVILKAFNEMMPADDECYKIGCVRDDIAPGKLSEICSVSHAEASIIAKAACRGISLKNAVIYVTHFPCPACAKLIALSGIKKIVYSQGSAVFDGARVLKSRKVEIIKI